MASSFEDVSKDFTRRILRSKVFQKTSDIQDAYPNLARKQESPKGDF